MPSKISIFVEPPIDRKIVQGEVITVVNVKTANVAKDFVENVKNIIGGRMGHYEALIETTIDEALERMRDKARTQGFDGIVGLRIVSPTVVEGGVEIVLYGNGFRYSE